jgi:hypothetical protein
VQSRNKGPHTANLHYDYSSMDDYFDDEIEPTELSGTIRDLHVSFNHALATLANNNITLAVPNHLIDNLVSLDRFYDLLDCLDNNPGFQSN